jgi:hypothetical protein
MIFAERIKYKNKSTVQQINKSTKKTAEGGLFFFFYELRYYLSASLD